MTQKLSAWQLQVLNVLRTERAEFQPHAFFNKVCTVPRGGNESDRPHWHVELAWLDDDTTDIIGQSVVFTCDEGISPDDFTIDPTTIPEMFDMARASYVDRKREFEKATQEQMKAIFGVAGGFVGAVGAVLPVTESAGDNVAPLDRKRLH